jgi:RNA polymerase sigma-70 factor (ECF subfamily)
MSNNPNQNLSDSEIVAMIQEGSPGIDFSILYKRYYPKVLDKCHGMIRDRTQAKDLTEDILSKAFEKLPSFRHQASFSSWLYSITYNHCVDFLREKKRLHYPDWNAKNELPDLTQEPEDETNDVDFEKLLEILELIHPEEKALVLMKYQDGLSVRQIGQALRISDAAVKMRLKRARTRIQLLYRKKFS